VCGTGLLDAAVSEIVGTKAYFAGEFCQCHDYCLVVEGMCES
jgi:acyl-CoA reductase-like NAD-dependent aldehyde dehydrogenase